MRSFLGFITVLTDHEASHRGGSTTLRAMLCGAPLFRALRDESLRLSGSESQQPVEAGRAERTNHRRRARFGGWRVVRVLVLMCLGGMVRGSVKATENRYTFTTIAGVSDSNGSDDGIGSAARFFLPDGVAVDSVGNLYVADQVNHTIRKITPGVLVSTLAGQPGKFGSIDGLGSTARFFSPAGMAVNASGNLYVADRMNHTIRKITPDGAVSTLAGLAGGFGSTDGAGTNARFSFPRAVALDALGNLYVADSFNNAIRKITPDGRVTTLAGKPGTRGDADGVGSVARFQMPWGVAVDSAGHVYVADHDNHTIRKITTDGTVNTFAGLAGSRGSADGIGRNARFGGPSAVVVDAAGNVIVTDDQSNTIRKITADATVSTLAGLANNPGNSDGLGRDARFALPSGLAVDSGGGIYVADQGNNTIRKIESDGTVGTLAGSVAHSIGTADGARSAARFNQPWGVAVGDDGVVYLADTANNTIRKITQDGMVSTLAGRAGTNGYADGVGTNAIFYRPSGVAVDMSGIIYVTDHGNHLVRRITSDGTVSTLAGSPGNPGSADGVQSKAQFYLPSGLAVDGSGNLYICDNGNSIIRKVRSEGTVTTLAGLAGMTGSRDGTGNDARFALPFGVAVDNGGNVYVADERNHTIRRIGLGGNVTTLAGLAGNAGSNDGIGSAARFSYPDGVAADGAGNVYVADTKNQTIRKIMPNGAVSTLAGLPGSRGSADGTGAYARFTGPIGIAADKLGNLYVVDYINSTVRKGTPSLPHPAISTLRLEQRTFSVMLQTARSGANYVLEFKNSLNDPDWVVSQMATGNGGTLRLTDTTAIAPARFYRIRTQP